MPRKDIALGSFIVSTDNADVDAFAEALGLSLRANEVPIVYSLRLLAKPSVVETVSAAIKTPGYSPLHHGQSFVIHQRLERNKVYELALTLHSDEGDPLHCQLRGSISDMSDNKVLEFVSHVISKRSVVRGVE